MNCTDNCKCTSTFVRAPKFRKFTCSCLVVYMYLLYAQIACAEDYTTLIINGIVTNAGGPIIVGNTGSYNVLMITNGGVLLDTTATIGNTGTASNNLAIVTWAGSAWFNATNLVVGYEGKSNWLVIESGGTVTNLTTTIGALAGYNSALVTGPSSSLRCRFLALNGPFSRLIVSNAGSVKTESAELSYGNNLSVVVTGTGSQLLNTDLIRIGPWGLGSNSVTISAGGLISNYSAAIGAADFSGSRFNTVTVTDPASRWLVASNLNIGLYCPWNTLVISNGGYAQNGNAYLGVYPGADSNAVVVSGAGTRWQINKDLYAGAEASWCAVVVTDGAAVTNCTGYIGYGTGAHSNVVSIAGPGSCWHNSSNLYVGYQGWYNVLNIKDGAAVCCEDCIAGLYNNSSGNVIVIDGPGARLDVRRWLTLGASQARNILVVTNGALLTSRGGTIGAGGAFMMEMDNVMVVTGPGSEWRNQLGIVIGSGSSRWNQLVIENSGLVAGDYLIIGSDLLCQGNSVWVKNGALVLTNGTGTGYLEPRYGALDVQGGTVVVDKLICTNGAINFWRGTIASKYSYVSKSPFLVGDGSGEASFIAMEGNHAFTKGMAVTNTGSVTGTGTFYAAITNAGSIRPGSSIGTISISGGLTLLDTAVLEFDLGGTGTNSYDHLLISSNLVAKGTVNVRLTNGFSPRMGDMFQLLSFASATGVFAAVNLPEGYTWTNRLLIDGTIAVVGLCRVSFNPPRLAGTDLVLSGFGGPAGQAFYLLASTNVALPMSNWEVIRTNTFDPEGNFSLTVPISSGVPHRFFRVAY